MTGAHISAPTATITPDPSNPSNNLAGNLNGTYDYYVTFYNSTTGVESRPQLEATTSPTLTDGQVTLSNLPAPSSGTWTSEKIYRSTNDEAGDTNLYEIANIPISTATQNGYTFNDDYTDEQILRRRADAAGRLRGKCGAVGLQRLELRRTARERHHFAE